MIFFRFVLAVYLSHCDALHSKLTVVHKQITTIIEPNVSGWWIPSFWCGLFIIDTLVGVTWGRPISIPDLNETAGLNARTVLTATDRRLATRPKSPPFVCQRKSPRSPFSLIENIYFSFLFSRKKKKRWVVPYIRQCCPLNGEKEPFGYSHTARHTHSQTDIFHFFFF